MSRLLREVSFVGELIKLNLAGIMEYRASFLTQAIGMFINNGIYFIFWIIFFNQFKEIRGYQLDDIFLLFTIITLGFGMAFSLAGNALRMHEIIAQGKLDYYMTLPRPVLPHVLFSSMNPFTVGDLTFGIISFFITGLFDVQSVVMIIACSILAAVIFVCTFTTFSCLAFFVGNANEFSFYMGQAMLSFSMYPIGLFQGPIRLVLYTLIPAALVGAVPVEIVNTQNWQLLGALMGAAAVCVLVLAVVFRAGLRRYESGSAINVNM